jgi:thioredoxin 1
LDDDHFEYGNYFIIIAGIIFYSFMASPLIVALNQENFAKEVLQSTQPVMVDFWAEWCGPCKMISPLLDELATEYDGKVKIGKVNADEQQDLAAQYGINALPTLLFFKNGQVVNQMRGAKSKRDFKAALDGIA